MFVTPRSTSRRSRPQPGPSVGAAPNPIVEVTEIEQAAASIGIPAVVVPWPDDPLLGSLRLDGVVLGGPIVERAHPNPADLADLVTQTAVPGVVIADRISEAGRDVLRRHGWGWLDRRGHLRLWQTGVRIEVPFQPPGVPAEVRSRRGANLWTSVGLELALFALIHPDEPVSARSVARVTQRSVGATHEMVARMLEAGLLGPTTRRPLLPDLFWEAAAQWPDDGWLHLAAPIGEVAAAMPTPELIRVDERAATLGGARIPAAGDLPARCYVTSRSTLRRLRTFVDPSAPARMAVRSSPLKWIPLLEDMVPDEDHPWRIAHPMLCALRLGADPSRGREIVESWGIVPGVPGS
ncbi:MAG: hypothetical protein R2698_02860 [Microthrixaceae bacterium]